jgi:hypothetical protein
MRLVATRNCVAMFAVCGLAGPILAQLYSEDFEVDPTASWTVNTGAGDFAADFFFDYSTVGIPAGPSGAGTRGMKLQANLFSGIFSGMSTSPNGQSFSGDYTVEFDWWASFNGPFPVGGSGSTQLSTFGIGTTGIVAQWPGGNQDSVWFAATGDGNSSVDWRAYSTASPTGYPDGSTVFAAVGAGNRNHNHPYYAVFGGAMAPAAQVALFPQQTGTTLVGCSGIEWHQAVIAKTGDTVTWTVDGTLIATIDLTTVVLGGSNIFFGHSDTNTSSSSDPNAPALLFTLIDNIRVTAAGCPCDFNNDAALNSQDYFDFLTCFFGGACPAGQDADYNNDGNVNSQDYFDFLVCFFSGCP